MVRSVRCNGHNAFTPRPFFISIALFTLLAFTSWIAGWSGNSQLAASNTAILKRADHGVDLLSIPSLNATDERLEVPIFSSTTVKPVTNSEQCRLVRQADDQCAFVKEHCADEDGLFSYIQLYYCNLRHVQPIAFIIIVVWLSMLFSTIGIAASDFLCINLSTIASILGMSESLAGVTFLAFGNGSPDVFSTFAAMGSNSGSLAVGELIGAACFITAVVAGSMALVRPFRVARRSFVRDVGYFIIAGSFSLVVLADGELHVWECATMIGLYVFYVVMVVSWHWYLTQKRRRFEREFAARAQFHIPQSQELDLEEPYTDDDPVAGETRSPLNGQLAPDFEELGIPAWKDDDEDEDDETRNRYLAEIRENMHVTRPTPPRRRTTVNPIRPSLVGALEFQSVLSSLQKAKNIRDDTIDLPQYSDDNLADQPSHRRRSSTFLNQNYQVFNTREQDVQNRTRSVSMNDAPGTQVNAPVNPNQNALPQLQVPQNNVYLHSEYRDVPSVVESPLIMSPAPSSTHSPRSPTPSHSPTRQPTNLLTVPTENFRAPNYQASPLSQGISPSDVSPMSSARALGTNVSSEDNSETSSIVAFPSYLDAPAPTSPLSHVPNALPTPAWATSGTTLEGLAEGASPEPTIYRSIQRRFLPPLQLVFATLFPTLCNWRAKTIFEKLLGVVAAPSVFILTLTVPVMDPNRGDGESDIETSENDNDRPRPIIRLPDDSPILPPSNSSPSVNYQPLDPSIRSVHETQAPADRQRLDSEMPAVPTEPTETSSQATSRSWYRWLTIVQAFTAPFFVVVVGWSNLDSDLNPRNLIIPVLSGLLLSLISAAALIIVLRDRQLSQPPNWLRPVLSFIGFIVGICWIATIADEVVSLLKTLGVIMNISDSLLGLTVFAVGNSLGDLVADVTVARLGFPVMALSACFGGPMLNILLGIGIGGLYMSWHQHHPQTLLSSAAPAIPKEPYRIMISKTLVISGVTLLVTLLGLLIIVPLNNWKMDRRIGWGLVALWTLSTLGNVIAEVVS